MERDTRDDPRPTAPPEQSDLGFGSRISAQEQLRLLNPDGSFSVTRKGISWLRSWSLYHSLIGMPWWQFSIVVVGVYLTVNALFALVYVSFGPNSLNGSQPLSLLDRYAEAFFFSVHTITTVGYGHITPSGMWANSLATLEAYVGMSWFAIVAGLTFARLSRPSAQILFAKKVVVAPYRGGRGLMLRIANERRSELIQMEAQVLLSRMEQIGGVRKRRFHRLQLERNEVGFLPMFWTIVHPIDKDSPMWGKSEALLRDESAEVLVMLTGIDETFFTRVHTRRSYVSEEIVWGARYTDIFESGQDGALSVNLRRLHDVEMAELPDPDQLPAPS